MSNEDWIKDWKRYLYKRLLQDEHPLYELPSKLIMWRVIEKHVCCGSCMSDAEYDAEYGTNYANNYPYCCCKLNIEFEDRELDSEGNLKECVTSPTAK